MKIDENTPSKSNDSADSDNNMINPDVIAKNGQAVLFKNIEYLV